MFNEIPLTIIISWFVTFVGWSIGIWSMISVNKWNDRRADAVEIFSAIQSVETLIFDIIYDSKKYWMKPTTESGSKEALFDLIHKFKRLSSRMEIILRRDGRFRCLDLYTQLKQEVTGGDGESINRPVLDSSDQKFIQIEDLANQIVQHLHASYNEAYNRGNKVHFLRRLLNSLNLSPSD